MLMAIFHYMHSILLDTFDLLICRHTFFDVKVIMICLGLLHIISVMSKDMFTIY